MPNPFLSSENISRELEVIVEQQTNISLKRYPLATAFLGMCKNVNITDKQLQGTVKQPLLLSNLEAQRVTQGDTLNFKTITEKISHVSVAQYSSPVIFTSDLIERLKESESKADQLEFMGELKAQYQEVTDSIYEGITEDLQAPTTVDKGITSLAHICNDNAFQGIDPADVPEWKALKMTCSLTPAQLIELTNPRSTETRIFQEVFQELFNEIGANGRTNLCTVGRNIFNIISLSSKIYGAPAMQISTDKIVYAGITYILGHKMPKNEMYGLDTDKLGLGLNSSKLKNAPLEKDLNKHETHVMNPYMGAVLTCKQRNSQALLTFTNIDPVNIEPMTA